MVAPILKFIFRAVNPGFLRLGPQDRVPKGRTTWSSQELFSREGPGPEGSQWRRFGCLLWRVHELSLARRG